MEAEEYRRYARHLFAGALRTTNPETKALMMDLAACWMRLAQWADAPTHTHTHSHRGQGGQRQQERMMIDALVGSDAAQGPAAGRWPSILPNFLVKCLQQP